MDSSASVFSCSSSSGEISSANPVKVHTCHNPFPWGDPPSAARGLPLRVLSLDMYWPARSGRLVDTLNYRERLATFLEVHERLAALSYGLDEVLYLVAVRHREAARVRAGARSRLHLTIPRHYLLGLVLAPACSVGVPFLSLASDVKVAQFIVVDDNRPPIPVHGD